VTFGDHDDADSFDTAPPDAAQVARRLHTYRRRNGLESDEWADLSDDHRARRILAVAALLAWGRREGWVRG
jgi:hypothetical protein